MKLNLEKEAEDFLKRKAPASKVPDRTGLRFYLGCALSGLLANGGSTRPEEVLNEAAKLAVLALQKENEL